MKCWAGCGNACSALADCMACFFAARFASHAFARPFVRVMSVCVSVVSASGVSAMLGWVELNVRGKCIGRRFACELHRVSLMLKLQHTSNHEHTPVVQGVETASRAVVW